MQRLKITYHILNETFNYYIGLGENAITLVNSLQNKEITKSLSHKRIYLNTLYEFYNPLNLTIDNETRDIAEYFKTKYFNNINIWNELNWYLNQRHTVENQILFLARILYPTYYFDTFEKIISGETEEKEIKKITSKANDFEKVIKYIYKQGKKEIPNLQIEWLEI